MSSLPSLTFASLLRRYRHAAGLTQDELADRSRLSVKAISALERGDRRVPRQETFDLLAEALGLSPAERAHLHQVARGQAAPVSASPRLLPTAREILLPLAGRRQELAQLARHLMGEGPPLLLLAGEPGIGKTRLLAEVDKQARAQGWTVLEGGCHRRSGQEPFTPLLTALEGYLRRTAPAALRSQLEGCAWLARLFPELAETKLVPAPAWSLPPEQERRLMFSAVARYLANVTGPAGTLLVLDDLQWAGTDALDLLASLLGTPGAQPLRVLGAYRSTEVRPQDPLGFLLADLGAAGLAGETRLGPLAPEEATVLLQSILAGRENVDEALREQLVVRTGGVPYFLVSCAQGWGGSAEVRRPAEALPWNVTQSIRQRVAALPATAQDLLGAAAVMGREAPGALLLAVASHPPKEVFAALDALHQAHLLMERDEAKYQFPHDLIREVVLSDLGALRRCNWHQQVAEAMEKRADAPPAEVLAYHFLRAGGGEKAALYLEQAGDRAWMQHANSEAAGYYQQLVEQLDALHQPEAAGRIREKLGDALFLLARYDEVHTVLEQALETQQIAGNREGQARTAAKIGLIYTRTSVPAEGIARLEALVASLQGPRPSPGLAELYTTLGYLYQETSGGYRRALEYTWLAEACAPDAYHTPLGRTWRARRAGSLTLLGDLDASLVVSKELLLETQAARDAEGQRSALYQLAAVYLARGAFAEERACIEQAMELADQMGDLAWHTILLHRRGRNAFFQGHWTQARQDMEASLRGLPQGSIAGPGGSALFSLGLLSLAEGRWAVARQMLEDSVALAAAPRELLTLRWTQIVLAEWDLLNGHPAQARARLEPLLDRSGEEEMAVTQLLPLLAWVHLDLGEMERASSTIQQAKTRAEMRQMRPALSDALRVQVLLHIQQQRWEEAQHALEEALVLCRTMPFPYAEAKTHYVYGLLHQAKGEPEAARERLEAALTMLNLLGERLYAEQVERALAEGRRP